MSAFKKNKIGIFIVIDGIDGSGKTTQTKILSERLRKEGYKVKVFDFPQYGKKSTGMVEEYLNGKFGSAESVGPYRGSIFYACDRYDASFKIRKFLDEGMIVISNRYVTANMGHQGGKIRDSRERKKYFKWLYDLEYNIFGIPKPDLNLILHVDAEIAQKMVDGKGSREYIKGKKRDLHEKDIKHLRDAERVYLEIAKTFPGFKLVECVKGGKIMSRGDIGDVILGKIMSIF